MREVGQSVYMDPPPTGGGKNDVADGCRSNGPRKPRKLSSNKGIGLAHAGSRRAVIMRERKQGVMLHHISSERWEEEWKIAKRIQIHQRIR